MAASSRDEVVRKLFDAQAVKFGEFTLKSGVISPIYFDLRVTISYPSLVGELSDMVWSCLQDSRITPQCVCGVPYTALPFATQVSVTHNIPMLMKRKEEKSYGTRRLVEGTIVGGANCVIVEDVVTTGGSVLETAEALRKIGLVVDTAVVLLNREQGGRERLQQHGITLHSVLSVHQVLDSLYRQQLISQDTMKLSTEFISNTQPEASVSSRLSLQAREEASTNTITKQLLSIMRRKQTNLAFSADVGSSAALLKVVEQVAPHICLLKTHVDTLPDFTAEVAYSLAQLAQQHSFLIMEDRKLADIGSTVQKQFQSPIYQFGLGWAQLVTIHAIPGPGVLRALREILPAGMGCVIVAEMSSDGTLTSDDYSQGALKMAEDNADIVAGLVCQKRLSSNSSLLHMTPGVHLSNNEDSLGQCYTSPHQVIGSRLSDIIIVGRGIYQATDPADAARKYQETGYGAYFPRDQ